MSSTSQLTTFSDLYTDLLNRVRVTTSVSASVEQAKRYINIALHDIHLGFDYKLPWCERQSYLRTKAPYTTGTVQAVNGSGTLSGTGTAWNTNNALSGETGCGGSACRITGNMGCHKSIRNQILSVRIWIQNHFSGRCQDGCRCNDANRE